MGSLLTNAYLSLTSSRDPVWPSDTFKATDRASIMVLVRTEDACSPPFSSSEPLVSRIRPSW